MQAMLKKLQKQVKVLERHVKNKIVSVENTDYAKTAEKLAIRLLKTIEAKSHALAAAIAKVEKQSGVKKKTGVKKKRKNK